jgi:hypothetical protein
MYTNNLVMILKTPNLIAIYFFKIQNLILFLLNDWKNT